MTSSSLQSDSIGYTQQLRQLMQAVGIDSFRVLAEQSQLSRRAVDTIRQGKAETLKYQDLLRLSQVLKISLSELMASFSGLPSSLPSSLPDVSQPSLTKDEIHAEYQLLKQQLEQQRQLLRSEFQQESLQILESLLLQLPTAAHAAQTNATMPARNLLPLLRPLDRLLKHWGITAIAEVGAEIAYDPHKHKLDEGGEAEIGAPAIVRYVGYEQGEKLLYRATVRLKTY
ncbi:helix-turn-helix transcriptional regulator [Tumidithrix elongata RA019]|uniref:Helix-turn-helix transcriptional regulator n=1 Tax=Tumidithrix elongata BACA0141 TaxID=2716417 RepID=A0AAW9Q6Q0_9CYAN|nr:helix-turn-helix transcriptional regulator [Tumidithrix elongata RA019]